MPAESELPIFGFVSVHESPLADGVEREAQWLHGAAGTGRASAHLWHAPPALVVPRSYQRAPHWAPACAASAVLGWPVQVRASGGGLVPQGPGVLNLSLAWPLDEGQGAEIDAVYHALCEALSAALARLGIAASPQPVQGSFCDGRWNLAVGGAKLVGTAQGWRRIGRVPTVLAHAVMLLDADPAALTERCNDFEAALGHERRYLAQAITSVARAWSAAHDGAAAPPDLAAQLRMAIAERLARALPPATEAG